jgi:hypothetical protein
MQGTQSCMPGGQSFTACQCPSGTGGATAQGAGGASTGGAGASTGGAGAGQAGSASTGGTGGAGGTTSSAGTSGGGAKGGAAGKSGNAGSTGTSGSGTGASAGSGSGGATSGLGSTCASDGACGTGLKCSLPTSTDFWGGGPPAGYCTKACTADGDCGVTGLCASVGQTKMCALKCAFGSPAFSGAADPNKCRGRKDVACFPGDMPGRDVCYPTCSTDSFCPSGLRCDAEAGTCFPSAQLTGLLPDGAACNVAAETTKRQCVGSCIQDVVKPLWTDQENQGTCMSPCTLGGMNQCGGAGKGACEYGVSNQAKVSSGWTDVGYCTVAASSPTNDSACDVAGGWFAQSVNGVALCIQHDACSTNADCKTAGETCRPVDGACGSYCLARDPTYPAHVNASTCSSCNCGGEGLCNLQCYSSPAVCYTSPGCCLPAGSMAGCQ